MTEKDFLMCETLEDFEKFMAGDKPKMNMRNPQVLKQFAKCAALLKQKSGETEYNDAYLD